MVSFAGPFRIALCRSVSACPCTVVVSGHSSLLQRVGSEEMLKARITTQSFSIEHGPGKMVGRHQRLEIAAATSKSPTSVANSKGPLYLELMRLWGGWACRRDCRGGANPSLGSCWSRNVAN